jgi:hypothetical protein
MSGAQFSFGILSPRAGMKGFFVPAVVLVALLYPPLVFPLIGIFVFFDIPAGATDLVTAATPVPSRAARCVRTPRGPPLS